MGVEIRPAKAEEIEEFYRVASTNLMIPPGQLQGMAPEWTLCAFEDGSLTTSYAAWPLTMRFNGKSVPVAGVTTVGTFPVYRRKGYLRKIITTHLKELYQNGGQSIAILYASRAAIYQRYGYAVISTRNAYRVEPRYLQFAFPAETTGRFRELDDSDDAFRQLVDLYRIFRKDRTGYLHRGKAMWDAGVLAKPPADGYVSKAVYEENGQALGYTVYAMAATRGKLAPAMSLSIRDIVWNTPTAYQAIWGYLANMDLVYEVDWPRVPIDDPLPHLLLEPRALNCTSGDGLLSRIVDVRRALPERLYPEEADLTFELIDELCPWNQGRGQLETTLESAVVRATDEACQLRMPVSTLAMLIFGQITATDAARMQRLEALDAKALPAWDNALRTNYRPFCADMF